MKKYLFVVVALLALVGQANAQRYLPGMRGVEFKGGFVDGIENRLTIMSVWGFRPTPRTGTAGYSVRSI